MTIKVGIIGCGSIATHRHAPEYADHPQAEIYYVYDPNPDRAKKLAERYGGQVAASWEEIVDHPEIDAISDCSTNEMHHLITTRALQRGKHVLCEKPIATTLEGARQIVEAAEQSGKVLMIDHNQRLVAAHQMARQLLQSGELGKVLSFQTSFGHKGPEYWSVNASKSTWFFKKDRSALGVAGDLGIHKVDLLRFLLDDEVAEVSAFAGVLDKKDEQGEPIQVHDNMVCLLKLVSGAIGTAAFSWSYYGDEDNSTILYGEKGIMKVFANPDADIELVKATGERMVYKVGAIQTNDNQTSSGVIDAFLEAVQGQRAPVVTGEDGVRALMIIQAAVESAKTGKSVAILPNHG
ncbi:gfo/Idh/MocA family oxidoreductase [Brevibacillus nitrificans]|uniref:Gfo/Idh/MocA family oxidoreductase n=1 Tax=Brevibacillus nitrificans TaxID=651560 RepID=A0A3M8DJH1_9BACL|nr:Gfo/Idh/MocA family oxidoreductase [Brevibacillus nitrificans]RNB88270.1 gfo/Idh/MocA family oxidoreductase [Brevibacillus nitrificans]